MNKFFVFLGDDGLSDGEKRRGRAGEGSGRKKRKGEEEDEMCEVEREWVR